MQGKDTARVEDLRPGDIIYYRNGGRAIVKNIEHFIGSGIGHQCDIGLVEGRTRRYSCAGYAISDGMDLDVLSVKYKQSVQWVVYKIIHRLGLLPSSMRLGTQIDYEHIQALRKKIKEMEAK